MKNLKKVLALVMALVMVMGMVVSASAADLSVYSDSSKITYKEALEVMTTIGVINGFEDGTMRPEEILTRAQATKIIAYLLLGQTGADSLSTTTAPFTDVAATNWAAGSIAYCVSAGIVDGYGDGTFGPNDTLTGYQFAKMLLCAIGYGQKDEFTGANWAIEVAKLAVATPSINLFRGNGADANNNPLSRQSAMQCALNALTVAKVRYSELLGGYASSLLNSTSVDYGYLADVHNLTKLGAQDRNGYSGHKWQVKNKDITGIYADDTIVATYHDTDDVTLGQLANLGDWDKSLYATNVPNFEVYVNGSQIFTDAEVLAFINSVKRGDSSKLTSAFGTRYSGVEINVVKDAGSGEIDKIVIFIEYLAQVTKVNAATASADRSVNITVYDGGIDASYSVTTVETDDFSVDDYILVVPEGLPVAAQHSGFGDPLSMKLAETQKGSVTASNSSKGTFAFGGTTYVYSSTAYDDYVIPVADLSFSATYIFYMSGYGTVIGVEVDTAGTTSSSLAYVIASESVQADSFTGAYSKVRVYYMDGTSEILNLNVKTATSSTTGVGITSGDKYITVAGVNYKLGAKDTTLVPQGIYAYRISNSFVTLDEIKSNNAAPALSAMAYNTSGDKIVLEKGKAAVTSTPNLGSGTNRYATSDTVLTLASDGSASKYTGYANFPNKTYIVGTGVDTSTTVYVDAIVVSYTGTTINNILVIGAPAVAAKADNYAYYLGLGNKSADDQYYDFYVNGAIESRFISSTSDIVPPNAGRNDYYGYVVESDGKVSLSAADIVTGKTIASISSSLVVLSDGTYYYRTSSTQVYDITATAPGDFYSTSLGNRLVGSSVVVVYSEDSNGEYIAEVIYII